jgi:drug/metabolite transporter (DMT)-like permease
MIDHIVPSRKPAAFAQLQTPIDRLGVLLVFLSALFWSFGGAIARFLDTSDSWMIVFWRSVWAAAFLFGFMLVRDGGRGTLRLFREMGWPGIAVGLCFATASSSFVVALQHTTVANILLMQAGVPLIAALLAFVMFGERIAPATGVAIAAVVVGVAIMVSESVSGKVSPIGDGLALLISAAISLATVLTRRFAHVRMMPATCFGTLAAALFASIQATGLAVSPYDMALLIAFGVLNLGVGLALFTSGARLIPAALAALLGTFEPILGPVWVWLIHAEVPSTRTIAGGSVVFAALMVHIAREFRRQSGPRRPGTGGIPAPN